MENLIIYILKKLNGKILIGGEGDNMLDENFNLYMLKLGIEYEKKAIQL